jgi:uncharacterized protein YdhG (YjbR/CyaY superfamily)
MANSTEVENYINSFPAATREILQKFRALIKQYAPMAEESLSYGMPGYKLYGKPLVYFAGCKKHIGFYATPTGHEKFSKQLAGYKQGKGSVQFPLAQPLPWELIETIIKFRIEENRKNFENN